MFLKKEFRLWKMSLPTPWATVVNCRLLCSVVTMFLGILLDLAFKREPVKEKTWESCYYTLK